MPVRHPDEFQTFELKTRPVTPSGQISELELENRAKIMPVPPSGQISRILSSPPQSGRIFGKSVRTKMAHFGFFVIWVLQGYSGVLKEEAIQNGTNCDDEEAESQECLDSITYGYCKALAGQERRGHLH